MRFWDTSALLPLCLQEPQTAMLRNLFDRDGEMTVWWGTLIEGYSALARLRREGVLTEREEGQARGFFNLLAGIWTEIQPSHPLRDQAARALFIHALRAADALQLAASLVWSGGQTRNLGFVCLDHRLKEAAYREGFQVFP